MLPADAPLWYYKVYWDGVTGETVPSFDDFMAFGPFKKANVAVKQFARKEQVCGLTVNRDVYLRMNWIGRMKCFSKHQAPVSESSDYNLIIVLVFIKSPTQQLFPIPSVSVFLWTAPHHPTSSALQNSSGSSSTPSSSSNFPFTSSAATA